MKHKPSIRDRFPGAGKTHMVMVRLKEDLHEACVQQAVKERAPSLSAWVRGVLQSQIEEPKQ